MLWCCERLSALEAGWRTRDGADVGAGARGTAPRHAPPHTAPAHSLVEQPLLTPPLFDDTEDTPGIEIGNDYHLSYTYFRISLGSRLQLLVGIQCPILSF